MTEQMRYRIEHSIEGREQVIPLDDLDVKKARSRARSLSKQDDQLGNGLGHSVYLIGQDESGTDQEQYIYIGGSLADKDLVKDWK